MKQYTKGHRKKWVFPAVYTITPAELNRMVVAAACSANRDGGGCGMEKDLARRIGSA